MQPFILHAHFYQPERVNPWTGVLDPEPSAAPDRDWNERIHRECYRPNAVARIFDDQRRIEQLVNNYERLSFNLGPTLLTWMEQAHPETYARVVDGDWRSVVRTGHGNALAQAYNHMILPLASDRDRRTQIAWGLADFRYRFNREAQGMWLPETAVDRATVDALIDAGVAFTVLAPYQAGRIRGPDGHWQVASGGHLDTSRPYRHQHSDGSGRSIAIFFYDGGLAQTLAFDPATADAAVLLERLQAAGRGGGLIHAALDGETFGHHHPFGELGLAYALFEAAGRRGLEPTNYAAYLAANAPTHDVEVVGGEGTAWSCAHGVGRWYRDCGCSTGDQPDWNQAWRTPVREALDVVRDRLVEVTEERGADLLRDPWRARDDYVHVRLGAWTREDFLERHAVRNLDDEQKVDLWTLLEAQRHAMVMYTSCGWFFSDVSGIETVYVLRSAARVMGLIDAIGAKPPTGEVLDILAQARSNKAGVGTGADVWRDHVTPAEVRPTRLAAHVGLLGSVVAQPGARETAGYQVSLHDRRHDSRGRLGLMTARVHLRSVATARSLEYAVAAVHLGGLDFHGIVGDYPGGDAFHRATETLWEAFPTAPVAKLLRLVSDGFEGREFTLDDALPEGRQQIVGAIFSELTGRFHEQYSRLYADHRRILEMLAGAGYELPRDLRAAAELTLSTRLEHQLVAAEETAASQGPEAFHDVRDTLALARGQGYLLDTQPIEQTLTPAVTAAAQTAAATLDERDLDRLERWLLLCGDLSIDVELAHAQEYAYEAARKARTGRLSQADAGVVAALGARLGLSPVAWSPRRP